VLVTKQRQPAVADRHGDDIETVFEHAEELGAIL
jgi:hypothetical protein